MKKIICICVLFTTFLTFPTNCYAAEEPLCLYSGYTEDNVYYEVYINELVPLNATSSYNHYVNVNFIYDGVVIPDTTIPWTQTVGDARYSGTLTLNSFYYSNGKTTANYRGTLYRVV